MFFSKLVGSVLLLTAPLVLRVPVYQGACKNIVNLNFNETSRRESGCKQLHSQKVEELSIVVNPKIGSKTCITNLSDDLEGTHAVLGTGGGILLNKQYANWLHMQKQNKELGEKGNRDMLTPKPKIRQIPFTALSYASCDR